MGPTRLLWAVAVVLAVAVVSGIAHGRRGDGEPKKLVMVAKQFIPAGEYVKPGTFTFVTVPQDDVERGTLTDARWLAYYHVAHPIYPGERFRTVDFSP